jgi:hypothetical protein
MVIHKATALQEFKDKVSLKLVLLKVCLPQSENVNIIRK